MSYTPTTWQTGDTITAEKLNNMESGIENAQSFIVRITEEQGVYHADKSYSDVAAAAVEERPVYAALETAVIPLTQISGYRASFCGVVGSPPALVYCSLENGEDVEVHVAVAPADLRPFIVTCTPTAQDFSGVMDKTVAEINEAYEAGRKIVFKVMENATNYMMADCSAQYFDGHAYPSFNAYIIMGGVGIVFAHTETRDDGTFNGYGTTIYPLTPMT